MDTEWTCHSGYDYEGSDHCPECGCEKYEMITCGWEPLPTYTAPDAVQFVEDMQSHGYAVEHYHGRSFWHGPAVRTDDEDGPDLQDVIRATSVKLQWDSMGYNEIVYPITGDVGELT